MQSELAKALAATGESEAAKILVHLLRVVPLQPFSFNDDGAHRIELSRRAAGDPSGHAIYDMGYRMGLIPVAPLIAELTAPHRPPRAVGNADDGADPPGSTAWSREVSAWALKSILSEEFEYGDINHPQAEAALLACLKFDNEPGLQLHAAYTLGQMHSKRAAPELIRIMSAAAAESARVTDKDMAGEAGSRINIVFSPPNVPASQLDAIELASTAAQALSWIDASGAADTILPLLSHGVADVRKAAIFALASAKHERAFELISPLLDDSDATVRQTAARQLGFVGDARAVPLLIQLPETELKRPVPPRRRYGGFLLTGPADDPRPQTLTMAAQSLGMLKDKVAGDALFALTKSDAIEVRIRATLALVQIGDERGTEVLRGIMNGDDTSLRIRLASHAALLTMFANNGYCPKLTLPSARAVLRTSAETDALSRVRSSAIKAVGGVSDDDTIEWLVTMSRSEQESLRAAALRALLKTTYAGRFDVLRQFLKDRSPICQAVAIAEFARLHKSEAPQADRPSVGESLAAIVPSLDDSSEQVRLTTLRSIGKLLTRMQKVDSATTERIQQTANSDLSFKVRQRARGVMSILPQ
jgi:HEAT repeat protein